MGAESPLTRVHHPDGKELTESSTSAQIVRAKSSEDDLQGGKRNGMRRCALQQNTAWSWG